MNSSPRDLQLADQLREQERWDDAILAYSKVIETDPDSYAPNYHLGWCLFQVKEYDKAIDAIQKTIVLNPDEYSSHYFLGLSFYHLERYDNAVEVFRKAVQLDPTAFWAYYFLGVSFYHLNQYDNAIEMLQTAIELNPAEYWSHHFLGRSHYLLEQYDSAIEILQRAIEINPNDDWSKYYLEKSRNPVNKIVYVSEIGPDVYSGLQRSVDLELLKRALTDTFYDEDLYRKYVSQGSLSNDESDVVLKTPVYENELYGEVWPSRAETMIGLPRLTNLQSCIEIVIKDKIPGDFIETGVWRGGACIFMQSILKKYDELGRKVFLADSFEGLPKPDPKNYPADEGDILHSFDQLRVSVSEVKKNFEKYGVWDSNIVFIKGFFEDTLPDAPIDTLAILRMDGDMFSSTWQTLQSLWKKLSVGGFILIDDYGAIPACQKAVDEFRAENGIASPISWADRMGVYWRKE